MKTDIPTRNILKSPRVVPAVYLDTVENNDTDAKPGMQAVEIGNAALVMKFEGGIDTHNTQY